MQTQDRLAGAIKWLRRYVEEGAPDDEILEAAYDVVTARNYVRYFGPTYDMTILDDAEKREG